MNKLYSEFKLTPDFERLTSDQRKFFKAFFEGGNILLTSAGGCGKSFCIKILFNFLKGKGISVGRTATTGVAALNIDGSTIHSWAGIGLGNEDVKSIIKTVGRNKKAKDRIQFTKVLVIDEISMASADLLNKLDIAFKYFRYDNRPFGGLNLIFVGDFLQLLRISKSLGEEDGLAFESRAWKEANIKAVYLKKQMRQDENSPFVEMLNKLRLGDTSMLGLLQSRIDAKFPDDGIKPIKIFCKNIDVNKYNQEQLNLIKAPPQYFFAQDSGAEHHIKSFDRNCPALKTIELKIGAQVMLLHNFDTEGGLVNGSIGVVESFSYEGVTVKFSGDKKALIEPHEWSIKEQYLSLNSEMMYRVVATRKQIPLKLAWAGTVHKVQGATIDRAEIDLNEAFSAGMVYVALSRVRSLDCLSVKDFSPSRVIVNKQCLDFYENLDK